MAAQLYLFPPGAAIAGGSAATVFGVGLARDDDPIEVLVRPDQRFGPVHGMRIHTSPWSDGDVLDQQGLRVTSPVRTCWDIASWRSGEESVTLIDRLLRADLVTPVNLHGYLAERRGQRGFASATNAFGLADGRAESPQESRLRVRLAGAGLRAPEVQYEIRDRHGALIARADLAWPEEKVAVEYDGLWHAESSQAIHHDRRRLNRILAEGWTVVHVTSERLRDDFGELTREIRAALRRAR